MHSSTNLCDVMLGFDFRSLNQRTHIGGMLFWYCYLKKMQIPVLNLIFILPILQYNSKFHRFCSRHPVVMVILHCHFFLNTCSLKQSHIFIVNDKIFPPRLVDLFLVQVVEKKYAP